MTKLTLIDILKERKEERGKYFQNYLEHAQEIKKRAEEILGKCRVYVFGSVIKGNYHPILSDIDILIVVPKAVRDEERSKIKTEILSPFSIGAPFEIHLISEDDYKNWYSKFIQEKIEV